MDFETQTTATIEKPEVSGIPKEILDMYVVPGYEEEYTEHSLQRYRRESEKLERDMAEANHILQSSDFSNVKAEIIPMLLTMATQEQMQELMNRGFETNDPAVMLAAAEAIGYAEKSERSILIKTAFETNDPAVMLAAAEAI
ncbi:MAG: HEAT repeat domain-containing protein, partial [Candidatus Moranbacteria bacterium]|nr:HEAT repeat domain-containing protein [Candidatus Moranbacteria bacterium]